MGNHRTNVPNLCSNYTDYNPLAGIVFVLVFDWLQMIDHWLLEVDCFAQTIAVGNASTLVQCCTMMTLDDRWAFQLYAFSMIGTGTQ